MFPRGSIGESHGLCHRLRAPTLGLWAKKPGKTRQLTERHRFLASCEYCTNNSWWYPTVAKNPGFVRHRRSSPVLSHIYGRISVVPYLRKKCGRVSYLELDHYSSDDRHAQTEESHPRE